MLLFIFYSNPRSPRCSSGLFIFKVPGKLAINAFFALICFAENPLEISSIFVLFPLCTNMPHTKKHMWKQIGTLKQRVLGDLISFQIWEEDTVSYWAASKKRRQSFQQRSSIKHSKCTTLHLISKAVSFWKYPLILHHENNITRGNI